MTSLTSESMFGTKPTQLQQLNTTTTDLTVYNNIITHYDCNNTPSAYSCQLIVLTSSHGGLFIKFEIPIV